MTIPEHLTYTKSHEWVRIEGSIATVGITAFALEQLGDITLVEIETLNETVSQGDSIGTIESVKAVSDLYAPLNGTVIAINDALESAPETINDDCYDRGWIARFQLSSEGDHGIVMDAASYQDYLDSLDD